MAIADAMIVQIDAAAAARKGAAILILLIVSEERLGVAHVDAVLSARTGKPFFWLAVRTSLAV